MRTGLFLSFRTSDSAGYAGRLKDRLDEALADYEVFLFIEDTPAGQDYREVIDQTLESSAATLVMIGPGWLKAMGDDGNRRLDDPEDPVRLEVEAALDSSKPVFPVLVGKADPPPEVDLPPAIRELHFRHAFRLDDGRFHDSVREFAAEIAKGTGGRVAERQPPTRFRWKVEHLLLSPVSPLLLVASAVVALMLAGSLRSTQLYLPSLAVALVLVGIATHAVYPMVFSDRDSWFTFRRHDLWVRSGAAYGRRAKLRAGYDLNRAIERGLDLSHADLRGILDAATFTHWTSARLNGADLRGLDMTGVSLAGADLAGANLQGAKLESADLTGANLAGAKLAGADLRSARLTGAVLLGSESDEHTQWPQGWLDSPPDDLEA